MNRSRFKLGTAVWHIDRGKGLGRGRVTRLREETPLGDDTQRIYMVRWVRHPNFLTWWSWAELTRMKPVREEL